MEEVAAVRDALHFLAFFESLHANHAVFLIILVASAVIVHLLDLVKEVLECFVLFSLQFCLQHGPYHLSLLADPLPLRL